MAQDNFKTTTPTSETWGENDKPVSDTGSTDWGAGDKEFRPDPGFVARLGQGASRALDSAKTALTDDRNEIAKIAADQARTALPQTALQRKMAEEYQPYVDAANKAEGVVDNVKAWGAAGFKRAGQLLSNPAETGKMMAEQLPNSLPGLAGGFAGMKAGAALGSMVAPGPGTMVGGVLGGIAGGFAGGYGLEKGAAVQEQVQKEAQKRGIDIQDQAAVAGMVGENYDEIEATAQRKGVGTAGTDAILNVATMGLAGIGGRAITKEAQALHAAVKSGAMDAAEASTRLAALESANAARNTLGAKALRGTGVVGGEMVGEGASEAVGQKYAYGEVDAGQVIDESFLGLGTGTAMALGGKAFNKAAGIVDQDATTQTLAAAQAEIERRVAALPDHQQNAERARLNAQLQAEARMGGLADEEMGAPDMAPGNPNDYRATPAWAKPPADAAPDYGNADDEIFQSTGTPQRVDPVREAVRQAADAGGSLSAAAGVAMDSGAAPTFMPPADQAPQPTADAAPQGPFILGADSVPLNAGGTPFRNKYDAAAAKKMQPLMRVIKVDGGYALAEKTPAQIAAQEKAGQRLAQPRTSAGGEPIPAHAFIASSGGISRAAAPEVGLDQNPRVGNRFLLSSTGMSMEEATQRLIEEGYLGQGAGINDALALIKTSLTNPQYTPEGFERIAQAQSEARFNDYLEAHEDAAQNASEDYDPFAPGGDFGLPDDFTPDDLVGEGYTTANPGLQMEVNALMSQLEDMGFDPVDALGDTVSNYANATQDEFNAAARQILQRAIASSSGNGGRAAAQAAPTPAGAGSAAAAQELTEPTPPAAMPVPGNFSGTPSATIGTRTDAVAGPGFGPRDLQSAIAQIRANKQQEAANAKATAPEAAPATTAPAPGTGDVQAAGVDGPGSDAGNGFKRGPQEGERYRVGVSSATGGVTLEKRLPAGTVATFYVGKDGGLIDADDVNLVGTKDREKIWIPNNKETAGQVTAILDEMGKLALSDPKRRVAKERLKALVTGPGPVQSAGPASTPTTTGATSEPTPNQAIQAGPQPAQAGAAQAGQPAAVAPNAAPQPSATWAAMPAEARQQVAQAAGLNPVQTAKALASGSIEEMPAAVSAKLAPVLTSAAGEAQQAQAAKKAVSTELSDDALERKTDEVMANVVAPGSINLTRGQVRALIQEKGMKTADKTIADYQESKARQAETIRKYSDAKDKADRARQAQAATEDVADDGDGSQGEVYSTRKEAIDAGERSGANYSVVPLDDRGPKGKHRLVVDSKEKQPQGQAQQDASMARTAAQRINDAVRMLQETRNSMDALVAMHGDGLDPDDDVIEVIQRAASGFDAPEKKKLNKFLKENTKRGKKGTYITNARQLFDLLPEHFGYNQWLLHDAINDLSNEAQNQPAARTKQEQAATENVAEAIPIFERYDDAMAWMKDRAKSQGLSVIAYRATDEFKNALSPQLQALYAASKSKWDADTAEAGKAMQDAMAKAGIRPGDTVQWNQPGAFLTTQKLSGVVKLDRLGVPHVHMSSEVAVAKAGGKIGYTKKLRWQPYMQKPAESASQAVTPVDDAPRRADTAATDSRPAQEATAAEQQKAAPAAEPAAEQGLNQPSAPAKLELSAQTPAEAAAQQDAQEQAAKAEAAAKRAADAAAKAEEERKRIAQASVRAADSFELGQDPLDSLTGQGSIFDAPEQAAPAQPDTPKLTQDEAKSLMAWEDLGQKNGVKTHALTFYESQADKDAKRGRMIVARVTKEVDGRNWMVEGTEEMLAVLGMAKKKAEQVGMARVVADGYVEQGATAPKTTAKPAATTTTGAPIEDAGEKIGGARKDRWKERGLNLEDLDAMTEAEGAELATKSNVWKPDYEALSAQSEPVTAAMVKTIYDQLAAKPKNNTPEGRRQYVQMMRIVRDVLTDAKGPEAVKNAYVEIRKRAGMNTDSPQAKSAARDLLFSVYKGRSDPFVLGYNEVTKAKKLVEGGFPAKGEPWKSRLTVGQREGGNGTTERGIELYLELSAEVGTPLTREQIEAGFFRVKDKKNKTVAFAPTKEDAEAAAKTVYERDMKGGKDDKPEPVRPNLDELKRENLPQRIDRDVTADDFVRDLGFRGIEFGNWSAQDERQRILNMAYDGLTDLAQIMGVPPKAMSLNGTLGMAFGARGGGRFAAHYEPGKLVINMTKIRGGGSMAHEWAHAMDHYFGELDKPDAYTTQARGASGWLSEDQYKGVPRKRMERVGNEWKSVEKMRLDNLRPEMAAAFDEVMRALFQKQITKAEMVRSHELDLERTEALAAKEQDADMKAMYTNMAENRRQALEELRQDPEDRMYDGRGRSDYASQAQALSGKSENGYWTRPTEMFARAFESWVFDKVTAMGARSDYLVHGVEEDRFAGGGYRGNPYPTGEERARINAAFDKLASTVKTKETDKGVALYYASTAPTRPGSAQDKAVMQAIADGKNARDVLRLIASGSKDPFLRQVAKMLLKAGITPNIEFGHIGKTKDGTPIYGQYRGKTDTIAIAGSAEYAAERIFMHEAMHAATMRALAKPGLPSLQLRKLLAHVQKQKGAAGFYGTKNVDEFVAEVFTNPDFQKALRGMSAPAGNSLKSAWDSFVRILRGILGLSNDSLNALSQALELGVEAVRQDMVLRKQGAQAGRNANAGRDAIDQTETENFKRWFKDSKVVDAEGKPLVVYHGTTADFSDV